MTPEEITAAYRKYLNAFLCSVTGDSPEMKPDLPLAVEVAAALGCRDGVRVRLLPATWGLPMPRKVFMTELGMKLAGEDMRLVPDTSFLRDKALTVAPLVVNGDAPAAAAALSAGIAEVAATTP